jgi:hypothetical protein
VSYTHRTFNERETHMHTTQIDSSNIREASWADDTLYLTFVKTGATYQYSGVPFEKYTELVQAESVGKFFHSAIKPNYEGIQLPEAHALLIGVAAQQTISTP